MCVAVPATVLSVKSGIADVAALGGRLSVDARLVPRVKIGDKVLVHAGCAISVIDEQAANVIEELLAEIAE